MDGSRLDTARQRIDAAISRIGAACAAVPAKDVATANPSVLDLVNRHEKLREEVAATIREVDQLIGDLEA